MPQPLPCVKDNNRVSRSITRAAYKNGRREKANSYQWTAPGPLMGRLVGRLETQKTSVNWPLGRWDGKITPLPEQIELAGRVVL
jgi:hypothetical protein